MALVLFHREFPAPELAGPPLVVLHGLYGSSRNWVSVAQRLRAFGTVYALDLRNHGRSPHQAGMSYRELAQDVLDWLEERRLERVVLMGHSMGGKVAMLLACEEPARVARLFVLDIAPVRYPLDTSIIDALLALDLARLADRVAAERQLAATIADRGTRLFLLTNLARDGDGRLRWQIPLALLRDGMADVFNRPLSAANPPYQGPAGFIVGGASSYWRDGDMEPARRWFPAARLRVLAGVSHNVHTDGGEGFFDAVGDWAENSRITR